MIFSPKTPLLDFVGNHYKKDKDYRITLNTKDNSCVFADIEYIRVPNFKNCMPIPFLEFAEMMTKRKWSWQSDSRYHSLYVYVIGQLAYVHDRDNLEIENYRTDYMKVQDEWTSRKRPTFQEV